MGVLCSSVLGEIMDRFDDPEGRDREKFIQALKEEAQKGRLVFERAIHLERPNGEYFLLRDYEECVEKFQEFVERLQLN